MPAAHINQTAYILDRLAGGPVPRDVLIADALPYVNPEEAAIKGDTYLTITSANNRDELEARKRSMIEKVIQNQIVHGSMAESSDGTLYLLPGGYADQMRRIDMVPLQDIEVGERLRKDLGDCQPLADSIDIVGLLHPVILVGRLKPSKDRPRVLRLAAGARRLEAFRLLQRETIPARIFEIKSDEQMDQYVNLLDAVENVQRLTPGVMDMREMYRVVAEHLPEWQAEAKSKMSKAGTKKPRTERSNSAGNTGPSTRRDESQRVSEKARAATGLSVRETKALIELHDRALGKNIKGDPKGWKPDFSDMQVAQGLVHRCEKGELTWVQARRELRELVGMGQARFTAEGVTSPPVLPVETPEEESEPEVPVAATDPPPSSMPELPEREPAPQPEPPTTRKQPSALVLSRPLGARAAELVLAECDEDEIEDFISALVSQRAGLARLVVS